MKEWGSSIEEQTLHPTMRVSLMHNAKGKQPKTSIPAVLLCAVRCYLCGDIEQAKLIQGDRHQKTGLLGFWGWLGSIGSQG